jgi:hypothetical protein
MHLPFKSKARFYQHHPITKTEKHQLHFALFIKVCIDVQWSISISSSICWQYLFERRSGKKTGESLRMTIMACMGCLHFHMRCPSRRREKQKHYREGRKEMHSPTETNNMRCVRQRGLESSFLPSYHKGQMGPSKLFYCILWYPCPVLPPACHLRSTSIYVFWGL